MSLRLGGGIPIQPILGCLVGFCPSPWREGRGYIVKASEAVGLRYPAEDQAGEDLWHPLNGNHWQIRPLSKNMQPLLINEIQGDDVMDGDMLCAFSLEGVIAGVGTVENRQCGICLFGDNPMTDERDGLRLGEEFRLVYWIANQDREVEVRIVDVVEGNLSFQAFRPTVIIIRPSFEIMQVAWSEDMGWNPDDPPNSVLDWNLGCFPYVFTGESYDVPVEITNTGVDDLVISDIYCDNNRFTADPAELVLGAGESAEVIVTFLTAVDDPGEFNSTMVIESNDPDNPEYSIPVHASATLPPYIRIDPNMIEDDILTGAVAEYPISVFNDGGTRVQINATYEIINEPGRDANDQEREVRQLRGMNETGNDTAIPSRDPGEWLLCNPDEFVVEADGGEQEVIVTIDGNGLVEGFYEADIAFTPLGHARLAGVFTVRISVECVPDIQVAWLENLGWNPDNPVLDWNAGWFSDVFAGYRYDVAIEISNNGTDDLVISDIYCDNNRFIANPRELFISVGETIEVTATFITGADDSGVFNGTMIIESNDPDNPEYAIPVHACALLPPEVRIEPNIIEERLNTGGVEDYPITIFNDGESPLRVTVTHEIISEPGRDANDQNRGVRQLRKVNENCKVKPDPTGGPTRDDLEEIYWLSYDLDEFEIENGARQDLTVTLDASDAPNGDYEADLHFQSNDPECPVVDFPVTMHVGIWPMHFTDFTETDANHSLQITSVTVEETPASTGWEIGVFTPNHVLSGAGVWIDGEDLGIAVWGADADMAPNQFVAGDQMSFKAWDSQANVEYDVRATVAEGTLEWADGGYTLLSLAYTADYTCVVPFNFGWNLISINITPPEEMNNANGPDIRQMMAQFRVDANHHHVILMKNERGDFYSPANRDYNGIRFWDVTQGYQVRMDQAIEGRWTGTQIDAQADVPIAAGWNMIAYFPTYQLSCASGTFNAFSPILNNVILAKDGSGDFAVPRNNFSNMDPWREGRGYQINVNAAVTLNYPAAQQGAATIEVGKSNASVVGHWVEPAMTGANMSVLVTGISGIELAADDQVAAFSTSGRLVGVGRVTDGMVGLAVWGDDASTEAVDGLQNGEAFTLKLWDADKDAVVDLRMAGLVYETDGFTAADAAAAVALPDAFYLGQNFPNPFNAVTKIAFGLPEASRVTIRVFDVAGREIATLVSGELHAGVHTAVWSAEGFNSAVYLVKLETPSFSDVCKVMLIK